MSVEDLNDILYPVDYVNVGTIRCGDCAMGIAPCRNTRNLASQVPGRAGHAATCRGAAIPFLRGDRADDDIIRATTQWTITVTFPAAILLTETVRGKVTESALSIVADHFADQPTAMGVFASEGRCSSGHFHVLAHAQTCGTVESGRNNPFFMITLDIDTLKNFTVQICDDYWLPILCPPTFYY